MNFVDRITYLEKALHQERYLPELVLLLLQNLAFFPLNWLQDPEQRPEEPSVLEIGPSVPGVLDFDPISIVGVHLRNLKHASIVPDEIEEQAVVVQLVDCLLWQLDDQVVVLLGVKGRVFVVFPLVLEVFFDFLLDLIVEFLVVVEFVQNANDLLKFVAFVKLLINILELIQYLNKVAHNIRKNGDSKKHENCDNHSFDIAFGVEIAETHGR